MGAVAGILGGAVLGGVLGGKDKKQKTSSSNVGTSSGTSSTTASTTSQSHTSSGSNTTGSFQSLETGTSQGTSTTTPYQQEYQRQLLGMAQQYLGSLPMYDPLQTEGWDLIAQTARDQQNLAPQAQSILMSMLEGKPNMEMYGPMMEMVRRQVTQGFTEDVLPAMATEALQYGGYGGAGYQQNLDIGAGRVARELGDVETQIMFQAMQDAQNQRGVALSALPAISGLGYQSGEALAAVGQQRRQTPLDTLSWYKNILSGDMGSTTATQTTSQSQTEGTNASKTSGWSDTSTSGTTRSNTSYSGTETGSGTQKTKVPGDWMSGAIGGGMMGWALSDRRFKKNIRRIGALSSGVPLYRFEYLWGGEHVGVMADEAAERFPAAVRRWGDVLIVNYGGIY